MGILTAVSARVDSCNDLRVHETLIESIKVAISEVSVQDVRGFIDHWGPGTTVKRQS
jgi:hypothetical protein